MNIKSFLKLVEIRTKVASVVPFFLGLSFVLYNFNKVNLLNTLIMFFAMIIFDMTVTATNNYFDYKRAVKKHGFGYEIHNAIGQYKLKESTVLATIIIMFLIATGLGIYLAYITDIIVLLLGIICFGIGIIYSYGPLPISRTPFGEIFSGGIMGLFIPFITIYINIIDEGIIELALKNHRLLLSMDILVVLGIVLVCLPAVFCIANIMLANNTCDIKDDFVNKRYTFPILVGKEKALIFFKLLYTFSYLAIVAGVVVKILPLYSLLVLLTMIPVYKNIKLFKANPTKKDTFNLSIVNFLIINVSLILTILLGFVLNMVF